MKKKSKKWRKSVISVIVLSVIIIILLFTTIVILLNQKEVYKIESRTNNVIEYQKENKEYNVDGWVRVQGTNIDYPVILADTWKVNLNNIVGDFTWRLENSDNLMQRTVILGHNIRNVSSNPLIANKNHSRFEQLMSFIYYDFAKQNQYIQYTKDGKDYLFKIFSVSFEENANIDFSGYQSKKELKEYIKKSLDDSYFKYDVEVDENDKIITLVTCTRFFEENPTYQFKIDAKLVEDDEKIKLSKVVVKDNYKAIEDIMKGGEENEEKA